LKHLKLDYAAHGTQVKTAASQHIITVLLRRRMRFLRS